MDAEKLNKIKQEVMAGPIKFYTSSEMREVIEHYERELDIKKKDRALRQIGER